jgi:hypothetical protein
MKLIHCKHCDSNLVNIIAIKIKHEEDTDRDIKIQNNFISLREPKAIKTYLRCLNCAKVSELVLKNNRGCCSVETIRHGEDQEPRNEILEVCKD